MNWRKRKKLWKKRHMWHVPGTNYKRYNGSNKSLHTMWRVAGIAPATDWIGVHKRTMRLWA